MSASFAPGPRSNRDSFFNKMKKKPEVQIILDNLDSYTVEQLANLEGSHFPQWIRDALVRKKESATNIDIMARAEAIAEQMYTYAHEESVIKRLKGEI